MVTMDADRELGPSDESLQAGTGRGWAEWISLIDTMVGDRGAQKVSHGDIASWLGQAHGVGSWWTQAITVGYERARGLRPVRGGRDGSLSVTASRTIDVPVDRLYAAFADPATRDGWLPGAPLAVRTAQVNRSLRFDFAGGATRVNVGFTDAGGGRSRVALAHERLPDAQVAQELKTYWMEHLGQLKALLEGR